MNSTCRTAVAAAVAGGYVLGRTRKAKVAFAVGTFLAGRRFGLTPAALAAEGMRQLRESPQLAELREHIGGDLLDAARAAASASADRRFSAFADTLRERGRGDREDEDYEDGRDEEDQEDEGDGEGQEDEGDGEDGEDEEDEEDDGRGEGEPDQEAASNRRAPDRGRKKAPAKKAPAKKAAARKTGSAKKAAGARKPAPAKKAAKKAPAKKTASSRTRSTTSRRGR